jgi:hypothetical protein
MSIENEAYKAAQTETDLPDIEETINMPGVETVGETQGISIDFGFLKAKTGAGAIEDYMDHPMNFKKSKGMAQMLRGFTGIAGELDLAIVDITLGAFQFVKEEKSNVAINRVPE